ncbi:MAG: (2Fe-2S)-binding protein [Bacteroidota bacterium]
MASVTFDLNGKSVQLDNVDLEMPLLWALREDLGLTGTKFGCGIAQCGVCTVHVEGNPVRSCVYPISAIAGKKVTTIEGLSENNDHPVQKAWIEGQVPQCGYCQSGQIMTTAALLKNKPNASDKEIENAMRSVYCRCGTYPRIKKAIAKLVKK